ncbi:MAG: putative lipid II flippase FtsW [Clostridiales bacterium]|nr:putative lipid II flippase FtsW [Clostridiales bacterium]
MDAAYNKPGIKKKSKIIIVGDIDYMAFLCVLILVLFGVVMVFSSSYYNEAKQLINNPDSDTSIFSYLQSQGLFAIIGFCIMVFMMNFNYRYLKRYVILLYVSSIIFLVLVLIIGVERNHARRWLNFGFSFQPSEYAKLALIITLAFFLDKYKDLLKSIRGYIFLGVVTIIPVALISLQPNLSTCIIILMIGFGMMFIGSPYTKIFIFGGVASVSAFIGYMFFIATGFRSQRFAAWLDPQSDALGKGYQPLQSLYAIASGGLFGLGLGQSRQKLGFIPEAQNDIIFSIICEELGFFGALIVLLLFAVLIWRGIRIALNAPDYFGCFIATGIILVIAVQVIINVAVVTNTIPNTGVPLPFISAGGTSIVIFMMLIGILLNISRYSKEF